MTALERAFLILCLAEILMQLQRMADPRSPASIDLPPMPDAVCDALPLAAYLRGWRR